MLKGVPLRILLVVIILAIIGGGVYVQKQEADNSVNEAFMGFDYTEKYSSATVEIAAPSVIKFYQVPADSKKFILETKRIDAPVAMRCTVYVNGDETFYGFEKNDLILNFSGLSFSKDKDGVIFIPSQFVVFG